jgi:hypothetical protein
MATGVGKTRSDIVLGQFRKVIEDLGLGLTGSQPTEHV